MIWFTVFGGSTKGFGWRVLVSVWDAGVSVSHGFVLKLFSRFPLFRRVHGSELFL